MTEPTLANTSKALKVLLVCCVLTLLCVFLPTWPTCRRCMTCLTVMKTTWEGTKGRTPRPTWSWTTCLRAWRRTSCGASSAASERWSPPSWFEIKLQVCPALKRYHLWQTRSTRKRQDFVFKWQKICRALQPLTISVVVHLFDSE